MHIVQTHNALARSIAGKTDVSSVIRMLCKFHHYPLTKQGWELYYKLPCLYTLLARFFAEGYLVSRCLLSVLPTTSSHRHLCLERLRTRRDWTITEYKEVVSIKRTNKNLIWVVMTIVYVFQGLVVSVLIMPSVYIITPLSHLVGLCEVQSLQHSSTSNKIRQHLDRPAVLS